MEAKKETAVSGNVTEEAGRVRPLAPGVRPDLLNYDDIVEIAPILKGHRRLVETIMHWLILDKCNAVHSKYCHTTGIEFSNLLIDNCYKIRKRTDNEDVIDRLKGAPFVTVSNHPYGALDGILLLDIIGRHCPDYKVMVNMFLNHITAMRPSFIAVDNSGSEDDIKKQTTMHGLKESIAHVRAGHPMGFFPAGAVSKIDRTLHISDRPWQESVLRLIKKLKVPVVPVCFHGHNSAFFNILGMINWRLRLPRLPRELFNKTGKEIRVSFGEPISVEEQADFKDLDTFGRMLRERTYGLKEIYKD